MSVNRKAFTMIELIFVIVIIGILATIAIPKLSATRNDAKIVSILSEVKTAMNNVKAAYTANPDSIKNQDWYGEKFNSKNKNGGCLSVFAYITKGQKRLYVSKESSQNSCDLNPKDRDKLFQQAEKTLGISCGTFVSDNKYTTLPYYYTEVLNINRIKY